MGLEKHQARPGREDGSQEYCRDEKRNRQSGRQAPVGYSIHTRILPRSGSGLYCGYCPVRYFCLGMMLVEGREISSRSFRMLRWPTERRPIWRTQTLSRLLVHLSGGMKL